MFTYLDGELVHVEPFCHLLAYEAVLFSLHCLGQGTQVSHSSYTNLKENLCDHQPKY